ncbi:MAG: hypothetical protein IPM54_33385 [Polyangiaceae bacterium]|nr:hypothetical protein [Polyangiaceae bacterium]
MDDGLKAVIMDIKERIRAEEPTALEAAVELTHRYPDEPDVWNALAYGYARNDNYVAAIAAMTRVMALARRKPSVFFNRGRYALMARDYDLAVADFTQGLVLCDELNDDYDREGLHFLRAEAYFQLGRKAEARADLQHVPDDSVSWTLQVRSKAELLELCAESAR